MDTLYCVIIKYRGLVKTKAHRAVYQKKRPLDTVIIAR